MNESKLKQIIINTLKITMSRAVTEIQQVTNHRETVLEKIKKKQTYTTPNVAQFLASLLTVSTTF